MNHCKYILKKNRVALIYLLISVVFLFPTLIQSGVPFKYDWGWPIFSLRQFWVDLIGDSSFGLFSALSRYGPATFGLFGLINFPPQVFLKIFLIGIHFTAGFGFYRFIRPRVKSEIIAVLSGIAYGFSPYLFIRTIVGFVWSMVAYAVLPLFLRKYFQPTKKNIDYLIIGLLFSLIFSQLQAGLLISLIILVNLIIGLFNINRKEIAKNYLLVYLSLIIVALPFVVAMYLKKSNFSAIVGGGATALSFIASLPHSLRNMLMLSDHHITYNFFYPLSHDKLFVVGWLLVWLIAFCAIFNKKNRQLVLSFAISSIIVLPFIKGPLGVFGAFYTWFFNHFPQIAVFRETYHFEYLYAIALITLWAVGGDWVIDKVNKIQDTRNKQITNLIEKKSKLTGLLAYGLKTLFAGSVLFIIAPYFTFDYAGYLKLHKIPSEYYQLNNFLKENSGYCKKIYYPPGLGFVYFKSDNSLGASNSDTIANSLRVPYLTDGASVLNLPSDEMFYRNNLVSQFYEARDSGEFIDLLKEGGIDCVILRTDTESKYFEASNLWREKDGAVYKKWMNSRVVALAESKEGLALDKKFGENVYIYKINNQDTITNNQSNSNSQLSNNETMKPHFAQTLRGARQLSNVTIIPISDWANEFDYYKDGWSRGRYAFWRKHLFAELRQDFIYTTKPGAILSGKIDQRGDYELWVRYLTGGTPGNFQFSIFNFQTLIEKDSGEERFMWEKLGDVELSGKTDIEITNISGENAVADLLLIEKQPRYKQQ